MTRLMCYGFLLLALVAAPWMGLYPVLGTKILCYALFACAFHLLLGYTGLASLGHAAFLGVGSYAAVWSFKCSCVISIFGFASASSLLIAKPWF